MISLGDLGTWVGGGTPSKVKPDYWANGTIPWVSPKDMKSERIVDSVDHITVEALEQSATNLVPAGSVLLVVRSGILKHALPVAVTVQPVTLNQDLKAVKPRDGVLPDYLAWALRAYAPRILHECSKGGTTVHSLEMPRLLRFKISLAPPEEQHLIVAEIEKQFTRLEAGLASLKRVQANLKRYRASVLKAACEGRLVPTEAELARHEGSSYEPADVLLQRILKERRAKVEAATVDTAFQASLKRLALFPQCAGLLPELPEGWVWTTVEQISVLVQYGSSAKPSEDTTGIPVLRMGNIVDGKLQLDKLKFLPASHREFPDLLLHAGDVLFNRTNSAELVGKTAVYRGSPAPCSFASYLIRIRLADSCIPEVLACFINSTFGRSWISSVVSQQVGQANVNGTKLQALRIPLPPLAEQQRIVREIDLRLSVVEELDTVVAASLKRAERLRHVILKYAFEGRLVDSGILGKSA